MNKRIPAVGAEPRGRPATNSGETAFSRWLAAHAMSRREFGRLYGIREMTVYGLAEPSRFAFVQSLPALEIVAQVTGIPMDRLIADVRQTQAAV